MDQDVIIECEGQLLEIAACHDQYLHGECHLFALALREVSGYPLGAFLECGWSDKGRPCHCLVHAFVNVNGLYVDIRGPHKTAEGLLAAMPVEDFTWEERIPARKLIKLGEGIPKRTPELVAKLAAIRPIAAEVWNLTQKMVQAMQNESAENP